jgi:hypothetical protein
LGSTIICKRWAIVFLAPVVVLFDLSLPFDGLAGGLLLLTCESYSVGASMGQPSNDIQSLMLVFKSHQLSGALRCVVANIYS